MTEETKYNITFTPEAVIKAKEQLSKRGKETNGLRLGLRGGGCDGFSIVFEFADKITEKDHIFEFDSVKVYIDPKSMIYINGTEVDYKSGLMGHGFSFTIPSQKGSCGCGESIHF